MSSYAQIYLSTAAETTIATKSVAVKAAGTTTLSTPPAPADFTVGSNRLTYTGATTKPFRVIASASSTAASNNQLLSFTLAQNGAPDTDTTVRRFVSTGTDEGAFAVHGLFSLATNGYVELWVANETSTGNLTIEHMTLTATD